MTNLPCESIPFGFVVTAMVVCIAIGIIIGWFSEGFITKATGLPICTKRECKERE